MEGNAILANYGHVADAKQSGDSGAVAHAASEGRFGRSGQTILRGALIRDR